MVNNVHEERGMKEVWILPKEKKEVWMLGLEDLEVLTNIFIIFFMYCE